MGVAFHLLQWCFWCGLIPGKEMKYRLDKEAVRQTGSWSCRSILLNTFINNPGDGTRRHPQHVCSWQRIGKSDWQTEKWADSNPIDLRKGRCQVSHLEPRLEYGVQSWAPNTRQMWAYWRESNKDECGVFGLAWMLCASLDHSGGETKSPEKLLSTQLASQKDLCELPQTNLK